MLFRSLAGSPFAFLGMGGKKIPKTCDADGFGMNLAFVSNSVVGLPIYNLKCPEDCLKACLNHQGHHISLVILSNSVCFREHREILLHGFQFQLRTSNLRMLAQSGTSRSCAETRHGQRTVRTNWNQTRSSTQEANRAERLLPQAHQRRQAMYQILK